MPFTPWAKIVEEKRESGKNFEIYVSLDDNSICFEEMKKIINNKRLRPEFYTIMAHDTENDVLKEVIYCKIASEKADDLINIIENWTNKNVKYIGE